MMRTMHHLFLFKSRLDNNKDKWMHYISIFYFSEAKIFRYLVPKTEIEMFFYK